jgi:Oligoendopeptidase F
MTNVQELPERAQVPEELTWDLALIYPNDQAWEADFQQVKKQAATTATFQGNLSNSATELYQAIVALHQTYRRLEKVYVYASMKSDQDTNNQTYLGLVARASSLATEVATSLAFVEPEIIALSDDQLAEFIQAEPKLTDYQHYLDDLRQQKGHVLDTASEKLVTAATEVFWCFTRHL